MIRIRYTTWLGFYTFSLLVSLVAIVVLIAAVEQWVALYYGVAAVIVMVFFGLSGALMALLLKMRLVVFLVDAKAMKSPWTKLIVSAKRLTFGEQSFEFTSDDERDGQDERAS